MKRIIYFAICIFTFLGLFSACNAEKDNARDIDPQRLAAVTVKPGPLTANNLAEGSRAIYDPIESKMKWESDDALGVIGWCRAGDRFALNTYFYQFDMTSFNEEYSEFTGKVVTDTEYLTGFYPREAITKMISHEIEIPPVQFPTESCFDCASVLMISSPNKIDKVSSTGNFTVEPFKFAHMMGFLKLKLGNKPAGWEYEEIEQLEIQFDAETYATGKFILDLDADDLGITYDLNPVEGQTYNSIVLNYESKNINLNELEAWAVLKPGAYDDLKIIVTTKSQKVITYNNRGGLNVERGVSKTAILNYRAGDNIEFYETRTITLTRENLEITSTSSKSASVMIYCDQENGEALEIAYSDLAHEKAGSNYFKINANKTNASNPMYNLYNASPLGFRIISVEVNTGTAAFGENIQCSFGISPGSRSKNASDFESAQGGKKSTSNHFTPRNPNYYPYFGIRAASGKKPTIDSIVITYEERVIQ